MDPAIPDKLGVASGKRTRRSEIMRRERVGRGEILKAVSAGGGPGPARFTNPPSAPGLAADAREPGTRFLETERRMEEPQNSANKIKFAVIGINHYHIYSQVDAVLRGGAELVSFYAKEPDLSAAFSKRYP